MAFVLEIETTSTQEYIKNYIISIIRKFGLNAKVTQESSKILCAFAPEHEKLQECIETIAKELPASFFLKSSSSYETDELIETLPSFNNMHALNLGLCPACQKEMFEVSSRRYYYPFTSCSCCGGNYSFSQAYPYKRENTSFRFIRPCGACESEEKSVGLRENHHLNSCHSCGVPVRLVNKKTERYANDAGSFRTMFEVVAKALVDNNKILIKTTMGYRLFYKTDVMNFESIIMMINSNKITEHLSLITQEFNALLSFERPVMNVTLKNEELKNKLGANTAYVKYPDDGFCMLLGAELQKLGVDFIAYEEANEFSEADMLMDYDLEVNSQSDIRLFLNKDSEFIAEGERVSFPCKVSKTTDVLSMAHSLVGIKSGDGTLFDDMRCFESTRVHSANVLQGVNEKYHSLQNVMAQDEASFMSVIVERNLYEQKCVGAYFDEEPSFLYYDGKKVIRIIPPKKFDSHDILKSVSQLRDGSDRLVQNLQKNRPEIYSKLELLQERDDVKLFEATAIILGLEDESMRGVTREAMKFVGKGGIQIDTHVKDNRFDNVAFLASIISYQLAGVSTSILSYSIFESFGDYFSEIIGELQSKTKAEKIILCGTHFANQSLFSRMQKNLKQTPPLMNVNYPIGKENAVVGGAYL